MRLVALVLLAAQVLMPAGAHAADWPQWRGPHRDGKSAETGLLKSWPAGGPKLVWKAGGLGQGYSSFAVVGNRLYTQGLRGGTEYLMAFDTATGKLVWQLENGLPFRERRGDGPRGTPTVEGDRVWAVSANGTLVCADRASGRKVWSVNFVEKFGGEVPHWGYSESPLIDGSRLIVQPGGRGASVVALDKNTGGVVWKSQSDGPAYSSGVIAADGSPRRILHFTSAGGVALRADNGELLWRYDKVANRVANIATPLVHGGLVFFSSDYGTGAGLANLADGKEVYFTREMKNHYSSSVLVGEHLYGYSSAILTAMNFRTGEVAWRDRAVGKGSLIHADGHLYLQGEDGVIGLAEAAPGGYKEKSRFSIGRVGYAVWTLPVIAEGRLYLRDQDTLLSYSIRN